MIEINNVSMYFPLPKGIKGFLAQPFKKRKVFVALDDVGLKIESGDRVAFLGINGAGKTTLLKLIGGLLYPTRGLIKVNGFNTITQNLKARRNVGFVLNEERSFYWRLTGVQNLEFFGNLDNIKKQNLSDRIQELMRLVGLEESGHRLVATYSSGMKQRLALARGLLANPQTLILDEPTRTLDPQAVIEIRELIADKIHQNQERTLLIATHRFDEAEELCNKICVMKNGKLIAYSTVEEIKETHNSISEYYYAAVSARKEAHVL